MRGAGDVSGSSNPGQKLPAALPHPGRHSDPGWMHHHWVTSQTCVLTNRDANGRLNAAAAGGGGDFFFHFSAHLKTGVQSQQGGADSSKCRISQISVAQLVLSSVHAHRPSCSTAGFSCTAFQSLNVPFICALELSHHQFHHTVSEKLSKFPSGHLYTTGGWGGVGVQSSPEPSAPLCTFHQTG